MKELIDKCVENLKKDEGLSLKMYKCPSGFNTIGYGHNLDANPITESSAMHILRTDIVHCIIDLEKIFDNKFLMFPEYRRVALVNLRFQTGSGGFRGFREMIKHIKAGNFDEAAEEMKNSEWYRLYTTRAKKVIKIFKGVG